MALKKYTATVIHTAKLHSGAHMAHTAPPCGRKSYVWRVNDPDSLFLGVPGHSWRATSSKLLPAHRQKEWVGHKLSSDHAEKPTIERL